MINIFEFIRKCNKKIAGFAMAVFTVSETYIYNALRIFSGEDMALQLKKIPKNPIIIEGFPGFGLVGTITTEFLMDHLKVEKIGKITFDNMPAIAAVHEGKLVEPMGIFYNSDHNLVLVHSIHAAQGSEWVMAESIAELAKKVSAKEIISIEGVGTANATGERTFYFTKNPELEKKLKAITQPLREGIIMGVTGAVLLHVDKVPISCLFAETTAEMPDSKAAARIIGLLDKYLGLKIDTGPLLKQAEQFEAKLKGILSQSKQVEEISEKKKMSYVG